MVTNENAKCDQKKWFNEGRCKSFPDCKTCDLKNLKYTAEDIQIQINKEREELKILMYRKKELKDIIKDNMGNKEKVKNEIKELDEVTGKMLDKTVGVVILQNALTKDFKQSFGSIVDLFKAKKEVSKWKRFLGK